MGQFSELPMNIFKIRRKALGPVVTRMTRTYNADMDDHAAFAADILKSVFIAGVAAWLTVQFSLRRFRTEKWWGKRAEAYDRVLEALHNSKAFSRRHMQALERGQEVSDEEDAELRAQSAQARREIDRAIDLGSYLLSSEATERLKAYRKEAKARKESWFEYLESDLSAVDSCLEDVARIARRELGIDRRRSG